MEFKASAHNFLCVFLGLNSGPQKSISKQALHQVSQHLNNVYSLLQHNSLVIGIFSLLSAPTQFLRLYLRGYICAYVYIIYLSVVTHMYIYKFTFSLWRVIFVRRINLSPQLLHNPVSFSFCRKTFFFQEITSIDHFFSFQKAKVIRSYMMPWLKSSVLKFSALWAKIL